MNEIVYLNNEFVNKESAYISPNDRGFIFADGVYEVIKYYNGKPFRYADHIKRLERSLSEISIVFTAIGKFEIIFKKLLHLNSLEQKHAGVYLQITRGANQRVHHFPQNILPTEYAFAFEFPSFTENLENGIKVITQEDIRWLRCDIKSVSLLPNTMLYNNAVQNGAGESILLRDGKVTEATHSSILGIKNGKIITHPVSNLVLPGITRKVILEICFKNNIQVEERAILENELYDLDEIVIAGTGSEVTPVIQVNKTKINNGKPGELTRFIQKKFFELVWDFKS